MTDPTHPLHNFFLLWDGWQGSRDSCKGFVDKPQPPFIYFSTRARAVQVLSAILFCVFPTHTFHFPRRTDMGGIFSVLDRGSNWNGMFMASILRSIENGMRELPHSCFVVFPTYTNHFLRRIDMGEIFLVLDRSSNCIRYGHGVAYDLLKTGCASYDQ